MKSWMSALFVSSVLCSACSPTADHGEGAAPSSPPPDAVLRSRLEAGPQACCTDVTVLVDFTIAVSGTVASTTASTPEEAEKLCAFAAKETENVFGSGKAIEVSLHTAEGDRVCSLTTDVSAPAAISEDEEKAERPSSLPPSEEEEEHQP